MTIDEARAKLDRKKVTGGDTIWMQQQNYSLEALMERDANDPFAKPAPAPALPAPEPEPDEDDAVERFVGMAEGEQVVRLVAADAREHAGWA